MWVCVRSAVCSRQTRWSRWARGSSLYQYQKTEDQSDCPHHPHRKMFPAPALLAWVYTETESHTSTPNQRPQTRDHKPTAHSNQSTSTSNRHQHQQPAHATQRSAHMSASNERRL